MNELYSQLANGYVDVYTVGTTSATQTFCTTGNVAGIIGVYPEPAPVKLTEIPSPNLAWLDRRIAEVSVAL